MVKSNEISASRFLMSILPILLILYLPAPQTMTSAYVTLLQAYTTHEYEGLFVCCCRSQVVPPVNRCSGKTDNESVPVSVSGCECIWFSKKKNLEV